MAARAGTVVGPEPNHAAPVGRRRSVSVPSGRSSLEVWLAQDLTLRRGWIAGCPSPVRTASPPPTISNYSLWRPLKTFEDDFEGSCEEDLEGVASIAGPIGLPTIDWNGWTGVATVCLDHEESSLPGVQPRTSSRSTTILVPHYDSVRGQPVRREPHDQPLPTHCTPSATHPAQLPGRPGCGTSPSPYVLAGDSLLISLLNFLLLRMYLWLSVTLRSSHFY